MLDISGLSIGYKGSVMAGNITARLESCLLTCLVGKNGAGKSTLIRTLAGFQNPISGSITIHDGQLSKNLFLLNANLLAKEISVVLTDRISYDNLTAYDVVSLGRTPYNGLLGSLSEYDISVIDNAFFLTGTSPYKFRMVNELSDGERQKVMIAKAIAQETPIILLDEPSAFLDYESKNELMDLLSMLAHEKGKSILVSSHDLDVVRRTADVFWIMENGGMRISSELIL